MARCDACGTLVLFGAKKSNSFVCCSDLCLKELINIQGRGPVFIQKVQVEAQRVYKDNCAICSKEGPVDLYATVKISGYVLVTKTTNDVYVCCHKCGVSKKWKAFFHCLCFGWWSAHGLLVNCIFLSMNAVSAIASRPTVVLSRRLEIYVMIWKAIKPGESIPMHRSVSSMDAG